MGSVHVIIPWPGDRIQVGWMVLIGSHVGDTQWVSHPVGVTLNGHCVKPVLLRFKTQWSVAYFLKNAKLWNRNPVRQMNLHL